MSDVRPSLGPRFLEALDLVRRLHAGDIRKITGVPYVSHLLAVSALVLEDGGTEEEAIAGLLHDVLEEHPEGISRKELAARFGNDVLRMVAGCTDTAPDYRGGRKEAWRRRKERYLEQLRRADQDTIRVAMADKVDNLRTILWAHASLGSALWNQFNAGPEDQAWLFRELQAIFAAKARRGYLLWELERNLDRLFAAMRSP
jgi:(p)ppGpp synthase/HD superfamily hydrolase